MKQKKAKLTALFLVIIGLTGLQAQQAVTSAGGDATGSGGTASYSVGQIAYTSISNANGSVNQGMQQPYEFFTNGIDENKFISLKMTVYPNPTKASVFLRIDNQELQNYSFQLYDMSGNLISSQKISYTETSIPMENLSAATYFLKVTDNNNVLKTFKIIKTQ